MSMTESEAIAKCQSCNNHCPQAEMACEIAKGRMYATKELIKCQKELEQYRAIGTVSELRELERCMKVTTQNFEEAMKNIKILGNINSQLTEYLQKYQDIGTVEEFRQLKEKATAKKPIDRIMFKECPNCGAVDIANCGCCPDCGQKLDWSEGKE